MDDREFEELVADALDEIPPELAREMSNVVILVEPAHPQSPHILGLYEGIALTERTSEYGGFLPDTITIYRDSILAICATPGDVREQVRITVIHEVAHHFGIDDRWLHEHGWA
jgi:predicted Zn-dependent protease with MMP-like domain